MYLSIRFRLLWYDYVHFPLWHRFGSKESKRGIKEALRKQILKDKLSKILNVLPG